MLIGREEMKFIYRIWKGGILFIMCGWGKSVEFILKSCIEGEEKNEVVIRR